RDDHRIADRAFDRRYETFQRLPPAADIDQNDVRPHALQTIEEGPGVAQILVLHNDPERQISEAGLRLLPAIAIFDRQSARQRGQRISSCSSLTCQPRPVPVLAPVPLAQASIPVAGSPGPAPQPAPWARSGRSARAAVPAPWAPTIPRGSILRPTST